MASEQPTRRSLAVPPPSPSPLPLPLPPASVSVQECQSRLINLPRELRNQIYREYIFAGAEDGYTYDFEAGKLRTAEGQPIDLNLMYTCRLIAAEMEGLALGLQTITFRTIYSEDLRIRANYWAEMLGHDLLGGYLLESCVAEMSVELFNEVALRYRGTDFFDMLQGIRNGDYQYVLGFGTCGDTPFRHDQMRREFMQLALTDYAAYEDVVKEYEDHCLWDYSRCDPFARLDMSKTPWRIPTISDLDPLAEKCTGWSGSFRSDPDCVMYFPSREDFELSGEVHRPPGMCRFSAAAAAIHFLDSIPDSRRHIRKIVLVEDREAVARPECHVQGLIPFCRENSDLRIERRISLWGNLFLTCVHGWAQNCEQGPLTAIRSFANEHNREGMDPNYITHRVAEYMVEAADPKIPAAITLAFDGDPLPELASRIFRETVQRDAAWQTALDRSFTTEQRDIDGARKRFLDIYHFAGFPEMLPAMCRQHREEKEEQLRQQRRRGLGRTCRPVPRHSQISCNFDPGEPWDDVRISAEIEERNRRDGVNTLDDWTKAWSDTRPTKFYQTEPPLAKYHLLFDEGVLPIPLAIHQRYF